VSLRIVHLFPKSPFLTFTAGAFEEAAPGSNVFLGIGTPGVGSGFDVPPSVELEWIVPDSEGTERITEVIATGDIAVFHSVGAYAASILSSAPRSTLKVWSGWGGDYYGSDASPTSGILGPRTARFERGRAPLHVRAVRAFRFHRANRPLTSAALAADVFSAPIPDDLAVFTKRFPGVTGRYAQLNYASVEDTFDLSAGDPKGDDVLLGNSASLTNNHLDVFEHLRSSLSGRRIIAPLSYGDPDYAEFVSVRGRALFGSDFVALRDFVPLSEYQEIVARCSTVVMGHRRQQGIGNIATALWGGAQVFLDSRNPLAAFLRSRGASIGSLEEAARDGLPSTRATDEQRASNVRLLEDFWSRRRVIANIESLIASA
jgi:hypothetical protein